MKNKIAWVLLLSLVLGFIFPAVSVAQRGSSQTRLFVAQTLKPTKIYASPNSKSRVYFSSQTGRQLIVAGYSDRYLRVKMSNGIYGYALVSNVQVIDEISAQSAHAPARQDVARGSANSRAAIAEKGLDYIGTPYVWGGNDINNGIDCSAFVKKLYGAIGVNLPRTAAEQAQVGKKITRLEHLQKGDRLYFYEKKRNKIGHTGIYLGNGWFVHSSRGKNGVDKDYLTQKWLNILVEARR